MTEKIALKINLEGFAFLLDAGLVKFQHKRLRRAGGLPMEDSQTLAQWWEEFDAFVRTEIGAAPLPDTEMCAIKTSEIARLRKIETAARNLLDNSPIDDKDRPYISDFAQSEFTALVETLK